MAGTSANRSGTAPSYWPACYLIVADPALAVSYGLDAGRGDDMDEDGRALVEQAGRDTRALRVLLLRQRHTRDQLLAGLAELARLADARRAANDETRRRAMTETAERAGAGAATGDPQVVVLRVGAGEYAVPIGRVQEIVRVPAITRVPHAGPGVEGVIDLRGRVLPIVDLAIRLGLGSADRGQAARVVVVEAATGPVGLLVDGVREVLPVPAGAVEPPSAQIATSGVLVGVVRLADRLVLLLDLDAALAAGGE
jgi:purine-binding chemotaxis protein CheW